MVSADGYLLDCSVIYRSMGSTLNLTLFLSYATLFPNAHFLLFFIIPVKAWIFAVVDLVLTLYEVYTLSYPVFCFPHNLFPLVAIGNYLLFFGKDVANVVPLSWRMNTHRCSVCGRTDVTNPELEFRYCSKCNGYHCYCEDHIGNHEHVE